MLEDGDEARALATFKRVLTILKLVVAQIDVIETMTPVQFLSFRERLEPPAGFQSGQFRELEAILGRRDPGVLSAYHEGSVATSAWSLRWRGRPSMTPSSATWPPGLRGPGRASWSAT